MCDEESDNDDNLFPDVGTTASDNREIRVRFVNKCTYPVDIFWLNAEKKPTKYGTLKQKQFLDIKTYKNHPWVARRSVDGCKLKMNNKPVFWPEPTAHANLIVRTQCSISMKIQTLKEIAGRSLIHQNPKVSEDLAALPRDLQFEIKGLINSKQEYSEIVCRSIPAPVHRAAPRPPQ